MNVDLLDNLVLNLESQTIDSISLCKFVIIPYNSNYITLHYISYYIFDSHSRDSLMF